MPDMFMDVDVNLSKVPVNLSALLDDTDLKTREEAVTFDQSGMDLVWNLVTSTGVFFHTVVTPTALGDYDWATIGNGMYAIEIPASGGASINNDTEGYGWFTGFATGILPWTGPVIGFRAAALNDALLDGGDLLDVSVTEWLGTACKTPSTAGVPKIDLELLFGVLLTEGGVGRLQAAFVKLFDVSTPTLVASDVMRGTNSAATETKQDIIDAVVDAIKLITDALPNSGALSDLATILADTAELQSDDVPTLIAAVQADTTKMVAGIINGTVDTVTNTHTPTVTEFQADNITEATADRFIGRIVTFLTGVCTGESTDITDYVAVGGIAQFTVTAMTLAPQNNDTFKIT